MVRCAAFLGCLLVLTLAPQGAAESVVPVPFGETVVVQVNQPWTATGHLVSEATAIVIISHGEYSMENPADWWNWVGPQGSVGCADEAYPVPGAPIGCLIARIGGGPHLPSAGSGASSPWRPANSSSERITWTSTAMTAC